MEENIRMGDSATALQEFDSKQEQRIRRAADLGGATEFVSKLPHGFKTHLGGVNKLSEMCGPDAHHILTAVTSAKGNLFAENKPTPLSGGQKQRLALLSSLNISPHFTCPTDKTRARTFMKPSEDVSLLIYDEPSASLDPQAEYGMTRTNYGPTLHFIFCPLRSF